MAVIHRGQKDEALSPSSLAAQSPSAQVSPVEDVNNKNSGIKVISSFSTGHQGQSTMEQGGEKSLMMAGPAVQPSMDPNQDLAGNIMV